MSEIIGYQITEPGLWSLVGKKINVSAKLFQDFFYRFLKIFWDVSKNMFRDNIAAASWNNIVSNE